jgi:DNA-binding transcriptional LysR family regulator
LTPAGRRILRYVEQIASDRTNLRKAAGDEEDISQEIRVGVLEVVTISWLPLLLERLAAKFPHASFRVSTGTTQTLIEQLKCDEVDLIFAGGPVDVPNITFLPIWKVKVSWLCLAAKYNFIRDLDVVELSRLPLVFPRPGKLLL